jgi:hypothetical protein
MTIDPELRKLERAAHRANRELVSRLEGYGELVPGRPGELALTKEIVHFVRDVERQFRGWRERCRDLREMLEDAEPPS